MPVLDDVIFGPGLGIEAVTYGQVRRLGDDDKVRALKRRVDRLFVAQVDELTKVDAPFPLALLTCVGIETLGQIMYYDKTKEQAEGQREGFLRVAKSLHAQFSRPLSKTGKAEIKALMPEKMAQKVTSIAHIIYYFHRHTLIHGYQSRAVYLSVALDEWEMSGGALVMNPYWFWKQFKARYNSLFENMFGNPERTNALRRSALHYLSVMLG
jgi:hypothetical protein